MYSSNLGPFTLPKLLGMPTGATVILILVAALGANRSIADPDLFRNKTFEFFPKVEPELQSRPEGGCG